MKMCDIGCPMVRMQGNYVYIIIDPESFSRGVSVNTQKLKELVINLVI
jgi:hypothetical protein